MGLTCQSVAGEVNDWKPVYAVVSQTLSLSEECVVLKFNILRFKFIDYINDLKNLSLLKEKKKITIILHMWTFAFFESLYCRHRLASWHFGLL